MASVAFAIVVTSRFVGATSLSSNPCMHVTFTPTLRHAKADIHLFLNARPNASMHTHVKSYHLHLPICILLTAKSSAALLNSLQSGPVDRNLVVHLIRFARDTVKMLVLTIDLLSHRPAKHTERFGTPVNNLPACKSMRCSKGMET